MLAVLDKAELAERVVAVSLLLGIASFLIGIVLFLIDWVNERQLRRAAKETTQAALGGAQAQGIKLPDVGASIGALAELAKALRALDRSTRLLVVSLILMAIAAAGAFIAD